MDRTMRLTAFRLLREWGRFVRDRRATIAVASAILLPVLVGCVGLSMDIARSYLVRERLGNAVDAAALSASAESTDPDVIDQKVQEYFAANYPDYKIGLTHDLTTNVDTTNDTVTVSAYADYNTTFMRFLGIDKLTVYRTTTITRKVGANIELALVVDISGSMNNNSKITDLISAANDLVDTVVYDDQSNYFSKIALVPYAVAVNAGSYATAVRGAVTGTSTITNATWQTGASKAITGVTKANPGVVTATAHGLSAGDKIWISGVSGMTQLNNKPYIVGTVVNANSFQLKSYTGSNLNTSSGYSTYTSGGTIRKCVINTVGVNGCEIQVTTSAAHGYTNGQNIVIKNVTGAGSSGGMASINTGTNAVVAVSGVTSTTFNLPTYMPSGASTIWSYTSGGNAYCTAQGCEWYKFTNPSGSTRVFENSTCVSERTGSYAYTEDPPSTAHVGWNYPPSGNPCLANAIEPLTSDKTVLHADINALTATGSTGGQVGIDWAWYMLSPQWSYLFPTANQASPYDTNDLYKIAVIMTDGELNSPYCSGVIAQDATSGSGSTSDHINCNATNGDSYSQGEAMCDAMKAAGIEIYTIGFEVDDYPNGKALMQYCATDASHFYNSENGADLQAAFQAIAQNVKALYVSK